MAAEMKTIYTRDYYGNCYSVAVSDEIYLEMKRMRTEEHRIIRADMRHRSICSLDEATLQKDIFSSSPLEDALIQSEDSEAFQHAITKLTHIQRRRVQLLLDDFSIRDIAEQEHCHYNSVKESVLQAAKKIHVLLQE